MLIALTLRYVRENYRLRKLLYKKLLNHPNIVAKEYKKVLRHNILMDRQNICTKLGISDLSLTDKVFDEKIMKKIVNEGGERVNQDEGLKDDDMISGDFSYNIAVFFNM